MDRVNKQEELIQAIVDYCWWLDVDELTKEELRQDIMEDLIPKLHSQGVVIKAERELPHPWRDDCMSAHSDTCKTCDNCEILEWAQFDLIEAGYVAVEPLWIDTE